MSSDINKNSFTVHFPFSAIVGQEEIKRALIFNAIDPSIGGLLITGTRGTAKSTAARAMAALLPMIEVIDGDAFNSFPKPGQTGKSVMAATPFVNLPVGATEDRVLGTLDIERALKGGERHFEPGLLARANRGVLYIDEVNLLPDHLVDVLLDAVAMGVNRVEREGVSFTHEALVILIGTMNPEEGELRPQLLDRFGLSIAVSGYFEPEMRKDVVRRRIAFEVDPQAFVKQWEKSEKELSEQIEKARSLLNLVQVPEICLDILVEACADARADGLRADIVAYKTARSIAAFDGRTEVNDFDVQEALELSLAHRRRVPSPKPGNNPSSSNPPNGGKQTDEMKRSDSSQIGKQPASNQKHRESGQTSLQDTPTETPKNGNGSSGERVFGIGAGFSFSRMIRRRERHKNRTTVLGKGSFFTSSRTGQTVRAVLPRQSEKLDLAIEATIRAAALDNIAGNVDRNIQLHIRPEHWRHKQRQMRTRNLILLLVDASGSMAAMERMQAAKGAVCSLLEDSYQRRDVVALISFRGETAEEILPPTRSPVFAFRKLAQLPTGGRTPLAEGLKRSRLVIERQKRKGDQAQPFLVVVTDGRATVPDTSAFEVALLEARRLNQMQVKGLVIDMELGHVRFGQARGLARELNANYAHIQELEPKDWGQVIREWVVAGHQNRS